MKYFICSIFIMAFLFSCSLQASAKQGNDVFPLREVERIATGFEIEKLAVSDSWLVVAAPGRLKAIDSASKTVLWERRGLSLDNNSEFVIVNDKLVLATFEDIILIDKNGNEKVLALKPGSGKIVQLVSVSGDFLYVIRGGSWVLEAYSIDGNSYLWNIEVGRGITNVFVSNDGAITYVISPRFVSAIENRTGTQIWKHESHNERSDYKDDVIYVSGKGDNSTSYDVSAITVSTGNELWSRRIDTVASGDFYALSVMDDKLVITARYELMTLNKETGDQIWQSDIGDAVFYNQPIKVNDLLYAKAGNGDIYAVYFDTGVLAGCKNLGETSSFFSSGHDAFSTLYILGNRVVAVTGSELILLDSE